MDSRRGMNGEWPRAGNEKTPTGNDGPAGDFIPERQNTQVTAAISFTGAGNVPRRPGRVKPNVAYCTSQGTVVWTAGVGGRPWNEGECCAIFLAAESRRFRRRPGQRCRRMGALGQGEARRWSDGLSSRQRAFAI